MCNKSPKDSTILQHFVYFSDSAKVELQQSKNAPVVFDNYKVLWNLSILVHGFFHQGLQWALDVFLQASSLVSGLEQIIQKGELTEQEARHVNEIVRVLKSEQMDEVDKMHLESLGLWNNGKLCH